MSSTRPSGKSKQTSRRSGADRVVKSRRKTAKSPHTAPRRVPCHDDRSGNALAGSQSSQAGFVPVPLNRVPVGALQFIPIYLRSSGHEKPNDDGHTFVLYRSQSIRFSESDRRRLSESGVKFAYIPITEHNKFRVQIEAHLADIVSDPEIAKAEAAALVYETSLELINELLSEPNLTKQMPRLEKVARAVTMLTINEHDSFEDLFLTAHHDFYTATHTVNVATWMVSLAYAMGYDDVDTLNLICQAGMLHDIGKIYLPSDLLNKRTTLTPHDWDILQQHPILGRKHISQHQNIDPVILRVAEEHHERLDGSGYPNGLTGDAIHPVSRICAVVDSFDAMTAFRPYKKRTMTVFETIDALREEAPERYDPVAVTAWCDLMTSVGDVPLLGEPPGEELGAVPEPANAASCRRRFQRFTFHCPARAYIIEVCEDGLKIGDSLDVTAHNISRSGLAFLSSAPVDTGRFVRVYLSARGLRRACIEGRVARCHAYSDGFFDVGVTLAKPTAH